MKVTFKFVVDARKTTCYARLMRIPTTIECVVDGVKQPVLRVIESGEKVEVTQVFVDGMEVSPHHVAVLFDTDMPYPFLTKYLSDVFLVGAPLDDMGDPWDVAGFLYF